MWIDLLAVAVLAAFAWFGARRGALRSALSLAGLIGSYAAAAFAAVRFGPQAAEGLGVVPPLGMAAAGMAGLVVAALGFGLVGIVVRRGDDAESRGALDRSLGALFGLGRGSLIVLLLGVLALWLDAARLIGEPTGSPSPAPTPLRAATSAALEAGVGSLLGDEPGAAVAARVAARPADTLGSLRRVMERPEVAALADDPEFWSEVEAGRLDFALARKSFQGIARDAELRQELAAAGVIEEAAAADPSLFRLQARAVLEQLAPRLRGLRTDPDLQLLASDPHVAGLLERGDIVGLLFHPGFQRVVSRALGAPPAG